MAHCTNKNISMLKMSQSYKCSQYKEHIEAASNLYGGIYSVLTWIFLQKLPFSIPIGHPYSQIPGRQHHATHAAGQELEKKKHDMSLRPIPHCTCCQSHTVLAANPTLYLLPNEIRMGLTEYCRRIFSIQSLLLLHKTCTVLLEQLFVIQDPRHPCTQLYWKIWNI